MAEKQKGKLFGLPWQPRLSVLLMALFLVFALTSGMVGFLLGRNASRASGELVDTIVLSPGESSLSSAGTLRFLSGRLRHSSGEPLSGAAVQLEGDEKSDTTDAQGKFYFSEVASGSHTLSVLDSGGNTLAGLTLSLDFSGDGVSADLGGQPSFQMPEDARMLEFTLILGEDQTLRVEEESAYFVTGDGQIVDFHGSSLKVKDTSRAVTPAGSLVAAPGYVLLPTEGTAVTPRGEQLEVSPGEEVFSGVVVEEDGSVQLEGGPVLLPEGEVKLPDGETVGGGDKVVVVTDGEAEELPELPEEYTPPVNKPVVSTPGEASSQPEPPEPEREPSQPEPSVSEPEPSEPGPPDAAQEPSEPEPLEEEPSDPVSSEPESYQGVSVIDRETGVSWKQQSVIDLFKNRTDTMDLGTRNGVPIVAPGSKGYYAFRLENPESFDIVYTISLEETSFHLPIRYSVIDDTTNYSHLYRERISGTEKPLRTKEIVIPAGSAQDFRIDWEWMYEDWYMPERDDALDTDAASDLTVRGRTYMLSVLIEAAQVVKEPEISLDGDIRYPGVH